MNEFEQPSLFDSEVSSKHPAKGRSKTESKPSTPPENDTSLGEGPIHRLMDSNFLQYASYVIRDRAIPDIEDGLKPVQRRILYSLHQNDDGRFIKVANIVGYTMQFHPHGDASIGDALVTLVNRGYLIEGQGNFGNIHTGDPAAAARYIECRLTDLASTQLFNNDLTEFIPSYDGRTKEPVALPAKLPLLLLLGAEGIAVGLSTRVLPHNFGELLQAQIAILQRKKFELIPDFPQGGLLDVREYDEGRGKVRLRAVLDQKDESTLVVRELPYGVTTESLISSIEDAVKKGKIKTKAIRDYTAGHVEIEIALPADASIPNTIQSLYAFTQCETSISLRPIVICEKRPVELSVHDILRHNTKRLVDLLRRELQIERKKIDEALHAASLVRLFIIHRIYKRIEECPTAAAVRQAILDGLSPFRDQLRRDITVTDLDMLLAIPIKRISLYDINKSRKEEEDLLADFDAVENNLTDVTAYTIRYLKTLYRDYSDLHPRKTRIQTFDAIEMRELTAKELAIYHDEGKGYIGYRDVDGEAPVFHCSSYDKLILVWNDCRYRVIPPPEKLFVDKNLVYVAVYDRDKVMTLIYEADQITHMKRFTFGGVIQNKDYVCTPEPARLLFFSDVNPETLYVKYAPRKGQQIHQQEFAPRKVTIRTPKTHGIQMTTKRIASISMQKPRNWDNKAGPKGALLH
ncbi:MAG: DNA topoisomerase IV subunit A [Verrucomicrobiota bacterium]|jgi:topoisomerase-4 subunit A|nr:DNA topoisomerase IV subunit A [Verrucomicrobiota bacterium]